MKKVINKDVFFSYLFFIGIILFFIFLIIPKSFAWTKTGNQINCSSCLDCTNAISNAVSGDSVMLNTSANTTGTCINFGAKSNIVFDCQNNSIQGNAAGGSYGISMDTLANNTIQNCNISNFSTGLYMTSLNNLLLKNIITNNNVQWGMHLYYSNNNSLANITANNNSLDGLDIEYSNNTILSNLLANYDLRGQILLSAIIIP